MFRIFSVFLLLSSSAIAGGDGEDNGVKAPPKSAIKSRAKPENPITFSDGTKAPAVDSTDLKAGYFPSQSEYDCAVVWEETAQTQEYYLKLKKECTPGHCSKSSPFPESKIVKTKVQDYTLLPLGRSELEKNSVVFDMEWAYALNTLERILGLTDEEFERYKYALKFEKRNQFHILFDTVSYFLRAYENFTIEGMASNLGQCLKAAEVWHMNSYYAKICARDALCAEKSGKKAKDQINSQIEAERSSYLTLLTAHHQRAITQLFQIIDTGLFESVKENLLLRLKAALFEDQKSEIGLVFDNSQMDQVRRFFIGIKQYLYMNLSEEEESFIRDMNAKAEADDEDEVSTDYESSEATLTDGDDEGESSDVVIPWDDGEEDLE